VLERVMGVTRMNSLTTAHPGVLLLTILGWASTASLLLLTLLFNYQHELIAVAFSAAVNMMPTFMPIVSDMTPRPALCWGFGGVQPAPLV
jgi:hypothetical protein